MFHSLVNLSDELLLKVIDALLEHDTLLHDECLKTKDEYDYGVPQRDDDFKQHRNLMNWSCTSSYFRNLLAPYIFTAVKLCNNEKSGISVETLLQGPHGVLIKELNFIGTVPQSDVEEEEEEKGDDDGEPLGTKGEDEETGDGQEDNENSGSADVNVAEDIDSSSEAVTALPNIVQTILSNLHKFPSLESLSIGFKYPYENSFTEYYDFEGDIENEDPLSAEKWRTLMTTTYDTLTLNLPHPPFKALEIRNFVWTCTDPYLDPRFHELLSHIDRFTLSIAGGDNRAGWKINTCDGYLNCVAKLDSYFFDHLKSATSLTLKAPEEGPIGLEGMRHARLALRPDQMPNLRELHLEYIFICPALIEFAVSHKETLAQLRLSHCYSSVNGLEETPAFYWRDLFEGLYDADLKKLARLKIEPLQPSLTLDEALGKGGNEGEEDVEVQEVRRVLKVDENRRLFAYAFLDDKYGMLFDDESENLAAFQRGQDQVAFDMLQGRDEATTLNRG